MQRLKLNLTLFFIAILSIAHSQTGIIRGEILDVKNQSPIPFANVVIQGDTKGVTSDLDGKFEITGLAPGLYNVEATFVGYRKGVVYEVAVTVSRPAYIKVLLEEMAVEIGEAEIVTSAYTNREESPLSVRKIGVNEVKRNPGGNRDISRAIRSLPGVASPPSFRNDIIIRGGAPNENRFYIDGIEIPTINHFSTQGSSGGPVGIINVDLIDDVEFYSGAFPAARGNALSSVMEFGFVEGRKDKAAVNAIVGSSDLGITYNGPTGANSSLVVSARRSYLQFLFQLLELPFLPTYNDLQFKWTTKISDNDRLTILGIGAVDQFRLNTSLADDPTSEDFERNNYLLDVLQVNEQWNYTIGAKWDHFTERGTHTFVASRNMLNNDAFKHIENNEDLPKTFDYRSQEMENKFRYENNLYLGNGWRAKYGASYEYARYLNKSSFNQYSYTLDTIVPISVSTALDLHKYGTFGQVSKKLLSERLVLSFGLRMDGNTYSSDMSNPLDQISPRFSASYSLTEKLSLSFNTGIYYQLPAYTVLGYTSPEGELVNKNLGLKYIQSNHLVAGMQYDLGSRNTIIGVEGFYKGYDQYPTSLDRGISLANLGADFGVIGNEPVVSNTQGKAYGLEFLLQQKLFKGFYGIMAYTYVRSEFNDINGNYAPSSWDSQHLISLTGGKKFNKNWEVGMRFLYSGGVPYTPYDVQTSVYIPNWNTNNSGLLDYNRVNTQRIEAYHQLDIRVDKKWYFDKWTLDLFLDIQNIYNRATPVQPILDVEKDALGNPIEDQNNPGYYKPRFIDSTNGSLLPTIGIIVEL